MTHRVLQVEELALQVAPLRQKRPQPVAAFALDVRAPEPAPAHDVLNAGISKLEEPRRDLLWSIDVAAKCI